jgi:hypothetical protein
MLDCLLAQTPLAAAPWITPSRASEMPLVWRVSSPDIILDAMSSATVRAAAVLKRQSPEDLEAVRTSLRERISSYEQDGSYAVPATACVISGHKPQ